MNLSLIEQSRIRALIGDRISGLDEQLEDSIRIILSKDVFLNVKEAVKYAKEMYFKG